MRLFSCSACQAPVFFENLSCLSCGCSLAYDPGKLDIVAFTTDAGGVLSLAIPEHHESHDRDGLQGRRLCANRDNAPRCNWLADAASEGGYCRACQLTSVYPPQDSEQGQASWAVSELAKRRWMHSILTLGLEARPKTETNPSGMTFRILEPGADRTSVLTGHADGVITINAAECDPVERLSRRAALDEPYRTLLGHFRHESGHYYWQLLVSSNPERLNGFRQVFGDERLDYAQALEAHYNKTDASSWHPDFVSFYAESHPWEDFAETWAHYLHMRDAIELGNSWGLELPNYPASQIDSFADLAGDDAGFRSVLQQWLPLSLFANSLNRSLGHEDAYPFAPSAQVVSKLGWIHRLVTNPQ